VQLFCKLHDNKSPVPCRAFCLYGACTSEHGREMAARTDVLCNAITLGLKRNSLDLIERDGVFRRS
jgi:hypothetical protein